MIRQAILALLLAACSGAGEAVETRNAPSVMNPSEAFLCGASVARDTESLVGCVSKRVPTSATRVPNRQGELYPAAQPTGEVGTAIIGGVATWYADPRQNGLYAALGPDLRRMLGDGWRGSLLAVCGPAGACVTVQAVDACACGQRHGLPTLIDLSPAAFSELAPLSVGVVAVSIEVGAGLPATDVEGSGC